VRHWQFVCPLMKGVRVSSPLKCILHDLFCWLVSNSFQIDEEWRLFYCNSIFGCGVIQGFDLCRLDDLWRHSVDTKWSKISCLGFKAMKFDRRCTHQIIFLLSFLISSRMTSTHCELRRLFHWATLRSCKQLWPWIQELLPILSRVMWGCSERFMFCCGWRS